MKPDTSYSHKRSSKIHSNDVNHLGNLEHKTPKKSKSNRDYRLRADKRDNYPNGYVEEWSLPSQSSEIKSHNQDKTLSRLLESSFLFIDSGSSILHTPDSSEYHPRRIEHSYDRQLKSPADRNALPPLVSDRKYRTEQTMLEKSNTHSQHLKSLNYHPVSLILSTQDNLVLNKENGYEIRFSTGMLEGSGISINETGNIITFEEEGSYRFEICGDASLFSDVDVDLLFDSDKFSLDIKPFSSIKIPKDEGKLQLRGIPTILPLQKGQTIVPRLFPTPDESIVLFGGTRLLIHRVA